MPTEKKIRRAILMELYASKNHAAEPEFVYNQLVDYFGDELTDKDFEKYYSSKNRWANKIQVTRNHMVRDGLILTPEENQRNEWKLSQEGVDLGRLLFIEAYGEDPWLDEILAVDNLPNDVVEKFKPDIQEDVFIEGREVYGLHKRKERDPRIVALKKKLAFDVNPLLPCEACGISFKEIYGDIGERFIEAHHVFPLAELTEQTETRIEDMILLCSNCHKMIHKYRPWLTKIEDVRTLLFSESRI